MFFLPRYSTLIQASVIVSLLFSINETLLGASPKPSRMIPEEYESIGGYSLGLGNGGVAAFTSIAAARINPALIPFEPQYTATAAYASPSQGRNFYQAGIVDSITSKVAAAVNYTGFTEKCSTYQEHNPLKVDSLVERRGVLALAYGFSRLSAGINVQYVDGYPDGIASGGNREQSPTVGVGIAGLITPAVKFGLSAENLGNSRVKSLAPTTYHAGVGVMMFSGNFTWHLDLRQRDRIDYFENDILSTPSYQTLAPNDKVYKDSERMMINSFGVRVMNIIRILAAYGNSFSSDKRQMAYAAIGLVQQRFALDYAIGKGYLSQDGTQSSIDLSVIFQM